MSLPRSVAEVLKQHVTLEVEGIDRMYLNVYQPRLQTDRGVAAFFRFHRGATFASSALMDPISKSFIAAVDCFVKQEQIPLITFTKGQRKDDITQEYRSRFSGTEGIVVVGKAREDTRLPHREAPQPANGSEVPLDRADHGHGQSLLLLWHRRGLRPVLSQDLHLLPLQRQALHQRP